MRVLPAVVASALLSACVPLPNVRYDAPAISGVVTRDGIPVPGAAVAVSAQFAEEAVAGATDAAGRFTVQPIRRLHLTATLIGDPLYAYSMVITVGERRYVGYFESGVGHVPRQLSLRCELSQPQPTPAEPRYCTPAPGGV